MKQLCGICFGETEGSIFYCSLLHGWQVESASTLHTKWLLVSVVRPSFKLIDEDLDEGSNLSSHMLCFMYVNVLLTSAAICINEVVPAAAVEDDECRIINENTIFDHIREKAKNLPVLTSLKVTCSPSLETLNLIRKRTRGKQLPVENAVGVSEEVRRTKVPCHSMVIQSAEIIDLEENRPFSNNDQRPYSYHVSNAIDLAGEKR